MAQKAGRRSLEAMPPSSTQTRFGQNLKNILEQSLTKAKPKAKIIGLQAMKWSYRDHLNKVPKKIDKY